MAANPQYAATPNVGIVAISTANANLDGSGTLGTVLTAGASGSRIDAVNIKATATVTAGMVRLFIDNGSAAFLIGEVPVQAVTPGSSAPAFEAHLSQENVDFLPITLPNGYSLKASTANAEEFNVIAQGGDF